MWNLPTLTEQCTYSGMLYFERIEFELCQLRVIAFGLFDDF